MISRIIVLILLIISKICYGQIYPSWFIPVVVNSPGDKGSYWRSDIYVTNTENEDLTLSFWLWVYGKESPYNKDIILLSKEYKIIEDVVFSLFDLENTYGCLYIEGRNKDGKIGKVIINSRTYTSIEPKGTYGQNIIPTLPASDGFIHYLNGIINNSEFRTNIGIFCFFGGGTFLVEYYNDKGEILREEYISLYSSGVIQKRVEVEGDKIYAMLYYINGDGLCGAYISRVDNFTNDSVFFPNYFFKGGRK